MFPPKTDQAVEKSRRKLPENVIVAVKADNKIVSKEALAWALTHVVHPCDCVMLLAVYSSAKSTGQKFWRWRRLNGDCRKSEDCANLPDRICQISETCSRMVLQFQNQFEVITFQFPLLLLDLKSVISRVLDCITSWIHHVGMLVWYWHLV
ncbi:hypothetical protein HanOQP8_Chr09g0338011 [Helianthus annuus]|nr:hypothetical protein HanOQP8_Chr09g0338011 [Helianthus annuus]